MVNQSLLKKTLVFVYLAASAGCSSSTPALKTAKPVVQTPVTASKSPEPIAVQTKHELSESMKSFIVRMAQKHHFDAAKLTSVFQAVELKPKIIESITKPAEAMPWYKYRKIFMTDNRIAGGVKFWNDNAKALASVEQKYGVPAPVIVAIIGVETQYGTRTGTYRVIDALSTLAFDYPKRSSFFSSELEQFLLLCREEKIDPLMPTGSYAGAMGFPQFMPSSYRAFAADYENDGQRDIWHNSADAIASVANYFYKHHWQRGQNIAFKTSANSDQYKSALSTDIKPNKTTAQLKSLQINVPQQFNPNTKAKVLSFELEQGSELWLGLENFYVITRYNHSPLYAMAVFQLSQAISEQRKLASISDSHIKAQR